MTKLIRKSVLILACLFSAVSATAEFAVDVRSTMSDSSDVNTNRFYLSQGTKADFGTRIWVVYDVNGDGVPQNPQPGSVLGSDDVLVLEDVLGGTLPNNPALQGRYQRNGFIVTNDISRSITNVYVYLWNYTTPLSTVPHYEPTAGATYGVVKAVVSVPAVVGNIKVRIAADVFANANSLGNSTLPPQPTLSSVTATTTSSNVVMRFSFTAVSGASYQVESTTNLSAVPIVWTAESGTLTPRAGVQNLSITNGPPIDPFKFFRLKAF